MPSLREMLLAISFTVMNIEDAYAWAVRTTCLISVDHVSRIFL